MPKKIAVDTLRALNKLNKENIVKIELGKIDGTTITANVHKYLDLPKFCKLIAGVKDADFSDDEHAPWNGKIIFAVKLVEAYIPDLNLPDDIGEAYTLINELGIYDKVIDIASNTEQFNDLLEAVYSLREFDKTKKTGINGFWGVITGLLRNFDINTILEILKGFNPEQLENLSELKQMANLFTQRLAPDNGVSADNSDTDSNGGSADKIVDFSDHAEATE